MRYEILFEFNWLLSSDILQVERQRDRCSYRFMLVGCKDHVAIECAVRKKNERLKFMEAITYFDEPDLTSFINLLVQKAYMFLARSYPALFPSKVAQFRETVRLLF